jgi:hypothetical protein
VEVHPFKQRYQTLLEYPVPIILASCEGLPIPELNFPASSWITSNPETMFRSACKVGFEQSAGDDLAGRHFILNPIFQALRYASRPIRSKRASFAEDFHLSPVRNFSASEVCVDSMGSPRGALARN